MERIVMGNVPEPDELYGREALLRQINGSLNRNNILLLAPRRFGKTGVMHYLNKRPPDGLFPLAFDLEDAQSGADFVARLVARTTGCQALRPLVERATKGFCAAGNWLTRLVESVGLGEVFHIKFRKAIEKEWPELGQQVMHALEGADHPLLFLFDELPEMLKKMARLHGDDAARQFIGWFRRLRVEVEDEDRLRRQRFVVGGSTGLNYLLDRRLAAPETCNDFKRLSVDPLELPDAALLCRYLAGSLGCTITDDQIEHLIAMLGPPVPYFIQMVFSELGQRHASHPGPLQTEWLDEVYAHRLMGRACKRYFDQYRRRLDQYDKAVERAAVEILCRVAHADDDGLADRDLWEAYAASQGPGADHHDFAELLADLECDWYLQRDAQTGRYTFFLPVMRDWWRRWYEPALCGASARTEVTR